jgi:hypothetical protein
MTLTARTAAIDSRRITVAPLDSGQKARWLTLEERRTTKGCLHADEIHPEHNFNFWLISSILSVGFQDQYSTLSRLFFYSKYWFGWQSLSLPHCVTVSKLLDCLLTASGVFYLVGTRG